MDINIIEDKNNALLNRHEVKFDATFKGSTPSRLDVRGKLAAMLNVPLELVILQKFENTYGMSAANGYAKIYEDAARMKVVEKEYVLKRNELPEAEVVEEAGE
ncbi:30S ribosomal protein S24e [Methanococcoides burtonii]|uniref:Small ribosomal subunit protein eS24 n=1 Tax=Methanococcoides burtonii (strain DSM 6242 / NBRC 107633 / OCM 468 / ACE-M) TaxID=259564 RepID=RS24_METBU|nr:30S ribosomal protein S24e [Methanococcoides burtonii]Q12TT3.1 RecName: Full=Small ribosomal subunit protein eS24; AltName: Full=30S ribosomal protein S24e [Methanococcoides burtonii DSM 6242]ABE53143.1 SSU ribosomal protein S24E [Methanococcoides burtonii DSM 6242]